MHLKHGKLIVSNERRRIVLVEDKNKSKAQFTRNKQVRGPVTGVDRRKSRVAGRVIEVAGPETEERYLSLIECAADGVVMVENGVHVYANRRFLDMFGYDDQEEVVGKPLSALVHAEDLERITNYISRSLPHKGSGRSKKRNPADRCMSSEGSRRMAA